MSHLRRLYHALNGGENPPDPVPAHEALGGLILLAVAFGFADQAWPGSLGFIALAGGGAGLLYGAASMTVRSRWSRRRGADPDAPVGG